MYEFLKTASDLRNILSHRNNVCVPSEEFLKKFKKITDEIIHPAKCEDIATKGNDLVLCHPGNKILDVIDAMSKKSFSLELHFLIIMLKIENYVSMKSSQ